jgi:NAD(P)-dependent dehydrogenase (short-subunit alcohol dehydrogenase family)
VERIDITSDDVQRAAAYEIDVLVNNAGFGQTGPLVDVPEAVVRRVFEVNVFGTLRMTQAVAPQMIARGAGRIIIVSSIAGVLAGPAFGPYTMSKFALEAMGKTLRGELFGLGVDVCLLNPGPYLTGFNDRMADSMWEWYGAEATTAGATDLFSLMRDMIKGNQGDPQEVVDRMVALVEADATDENNFVPADLKQQLGLA